MYHPNKTAPDAEPEMEPGSEMFTKCTRKAMDDPRKTTPHVLNNAPGEKKFFKKKREKIRKSVHLHCWDSRRYSFAPGLAQDAQHCTLRSCFQELLQPIPFCLPTPTYLTHVYFRCLTKTIVSKKMKQAQITRNSEN